MIGYLDTPSGISGDMFLGCLVGAGWPLAELEAWLRGWGCRRSLHAGARASDAGPAGGYAGEGGCAGAMSTAIWATSNASSVRRTCRRRCRSAPSPSSGAWRMRKPRCMGLRSEGCIFTRWAPSTPLSTSSERVRGCMRWDRASLRFGAAAGRGWQIVRTVAFRCPPQLPWRCWRRPAAPARPARRRTGDADRRPCWLSWPSFAARLRVQRIGMGAGKEFE